MTGWFWTNRGRFTLPASTSKKGLPATTQRWDTERPERGVESSTRSFPPSRTTPAGWRSKRGRKMKMGLSRVLGTGLWAMGGTVACR